MVDQADDIWGQIVEAADRDDSDTAMRLLDAWGISQGCAPLADQLPVTADEWQAIKAFISARQELLTKRRAEQQLAELDS